MLRMKRYIAVWGSIFFFVVCCSLYLMLETLNIHSAKPEQVLNEVNLDSIEGKIKRIEGDLKKNQDTIGRIKDTVKKLANGEQDGLDSLKHIFDSRGEDSNVINMVQPPKDDMNILEPGKEISIAEGMCLLQEAPAAKADIQMSHLFDSLLFDNPDGGVWKQGWDITYSATQWDTEKLKIVVVPHSHTDPGWIKTFDKYYLDQTQHIFDNMLTKLEADPRRRFIYAEMSFFSIWWGEIDQDRQERVKKLIASGQLEIVTGGWVMTDEANAHYFAMVDQMIEGHQWLEGTLGIKPHTGWAIDPFGHSPTMAYILKRVGIRNMLIQRIHYSIKKQLAREKQLEFRWRQHWDQDGSTDTFCHMMPFYSYDVPHTCGPDPMICCQFDFKRLPGGNVACPWNVPPVPITPENLATKANQLLDQYRKKSQLYQNNIVLIILGDDFRYDKPEEWDNQFTNYQTLFDYINSHSELGAEVKFGTLSEYFDVVYERSKVADPSKSLPNYPVLSGDFFTYADREDHYWSGYFTSRPFYKHLDRIAEHHVRSAEVLFSLALAYGRKKGANAFPASQLMKNLVTARRNLALFQHHDGITGTAKDFVVVDYGNRLLNAILDLKRLIVESSYFLMTADKKSYTYQEAAPVFNIDEERIYHDALPNKTVLEVSDVPQPVLFYNSLGHKREQLVTVYVSSPYVEVKNIEDYIVPSQAGPYWQDDGKISTKQYKVSFIIQVPALGISRYMIRTVPEGSNPQHKFSFIHIYNQGSPGTSKQGPFSIETIAPEDFDIENSYIQTKFSGTTGLLQSVTTKLDGKSHDAKLSFITYGVQIAKERSGAYLFLPDGVGKPVMITSPVIHVLRGPLMSEVHVNLPFVEHIVRLQNSPGLDGSSVEIHNIVDIKGEVNKELAMRFDTDISNTEREFYTDLNGFQMQKRKTLDKLPLQANYYPMPAMMYIQDEQTRISLLTGQALGVASLTSGQFEVMQDRRLSQDDNRGLGQGVLDNKRTPNKFRLLIETRHGKQPPAHSTPYPSLRAHLTLNQFIYPIFIFPKNAHITSWSLLQSFDPLKQDLPCELHLLNLRTLQNADDKPQIKFIPKETVAMLLHHVGFDCGFSTAGLGCTTNQGKVDISALFRDVTPAQVKSTSLSLMHDDGELASPVIHVPPMEINTYKLSLV